MVPLDVDQLLACLNVSDKPKAKNPNVPMPNLPNHIPLVLKAKIERIMKVHGTSERDLYMHVVWSFGQRELAAVAGNLKCFWCRIICW